MVIREIFVAEKEGYNQIVSHPCQAWEWGEFRKKTGAQAIRIGVFEREKLVSAYQLTIHHIPYTKYPIGYLPRGPMIDEEMVATLQKIGREKNCIFFRIEPNVLANPASQDSSGIHQSLAINHYLRSSSRPFFYKHTFLIDLTRSEEELLMRMSQKTRYNARLAKRHGVKVAHNNSDETFEIYLKLLRETVRRQRFFAHTEGYHRKMWTTLNQNKLGSDQALAIHLLKAEYQGEVLSVWILFKFHDVLYYPYGASSSLHHNLMANNLMMWEAIKLGKKLGCKTFDLWGCLGPHPDPKDSWYGFHRFKEGYGGKLVEFIGSYDLVFNPIPYKLYNIVDNLRWNLLRLKARLF